MSRRVDYYYSLVSPWSCLGHRDFIAMARKHGVEVRYRPAAFSEVFPESGGLPLAKRHPLRQAYRLVDLQRWRERRGIPLRLHPKFWPLDPRLADRTVIALAEQGQDVEAFLPRAFAGVFVEERDLADPAVVAALLAEAGIAPEPVLAAAKSEACAATYAANTAAALEAGVFGAPSYVLDGEVFWGQDRIECLDEALTSARPPYHADI